jgi:hypothetical protein
MNGSNWEYTIRGLSDADLTMMKSTVDREVRRRKRIAKSNATWTSNQGLEACLEASLKGKK